MSARATALLLWLAAAVPVVVEASWFEACELEGEVLAAARDRAGGPGAYRVEVRIDDAAPTPRAESYTDCREYMGTTVDVTIVFARGRGPKPGQFLRFQRTAADGFDAQGGHAGTTIRTRLRSLQATPPDPRRDDE